MTTQPARYQWLANPRAIAGALVLVTLVVFWEAQYYPFFAVDDDAYAVTNPMTRQGVTFDNLVTAFTTFQVTNYHPLTMISLMLDTSLFGFSPGVFHRVNVFIHILNTLLLFWLLLKTTRALWPSAAVAFLFAVHPLHVEPVVWISSRKDVLSTLFMLAAIAVYVRFVRTRTVTSYVLVCAAFLCALLSKQMPVTLPFVLLLFDYWPLNRIQLERTGLKAAGRLVMEKLPLFALAVLFSILVILAQRSGGALLSTENVPVSDRLKNTPVAYVVYLAQTLIPAGLQAIGYRIPHNLPLWQPLAALLLLAAITAAVVAYLRKAPYLAVGWFFYLGTFVPVIGLVTLASTYRADRYTYVPLIGLFIMAAFGAAHLFHLPAVRTRRTLAAGVAAIALLAYTAAGWNYVGMWRNNEAMLKRVIAIDPGHFLAKVALGDHYLAQDRLYEAAEVYLEVARTAPPAFGYASNRLGKIQYDLGQYKRAEMFFEKGYEFEPNDIRGIIGLSRTKAELGKFDEARRILQDAIESGHRHTAALEFELERLQSRRP